MEDARPRKRARSASGAAKKPVVKKAYYGRQQGELKFFDTSLSFNVDQTGEVPVTGQLCLIPQGVTESTRVGRKCVLKSILIRFSVLQVPAAAATSADCGAIYLVLDKQTNGAAATAADVFTGTNFPIALHNLSNSGRFVILKKWVWTEQAMSGVTTAYNQSVKHYEFFKKCNIPLEFSSTAGAITELRSNNVFLLAGAQFTDDLMQVAGNCRVRFSDGS